ncbi:MAG: hypothetical protein NC181_00375 [Clostridium sp.]|nr:hypothetical protein [Clostridium sp.]MCM1443880.1 hypothetical protein [Candidatus Amulumruptor caecigallinarius]
MKNKSIFKLGIFVAAFFVGIFSVSAKTTYTSYKAGDKIKVNVSSSKQLDFYVIEDSTSENVTAIYDGVLGDCFGFGAITDSFEGSIAQTKLNELTSDWNNPTEIRLIKVSEIDSSIELSNLKDSGVEVREPSYYMATKPYWTQDVIKDGAALLPIDVTSWVTYFSIEAVADSNDGTGIQSAIRPVITVSKDYVVGGSKISEEDKLWNNFVSKYKTTDLVKMLSEGEDTTINITSTDDTLKIEFTNGADTTTTNFTYSNGIVAYTPPINATDNNLIMDNMWVTNCIYAIADLKGYDIEKLITWLGENENPNLATHGIEIKTEKNTIHLEDVSDVNINTGSITLTTGKILSFKLDIKNGLKITNTEEKKDTVVKNPETGDKSSIIVFASIATLLIGTVAYIKLKKYSKFPQA